MRTCCGVQRKLGIRALTFALCLLHFCAWSAVAAEEADSFAGTYRDERVTVDLDAPQRTGNGTSYTGTIQLGDQKFPLKADAQEAHLSGTFESQGDHFKFEGTMVGGLFVLTTDGVTYRLKKQAVNPLAPTASRPNPLAAPKKATTAPTKPPAKEVVVQKPARGVMQFKRFSVLDRATMIGGEAFSLLVPVDWEVEGGLAWRMHPTLPAYVAMRIMNSNRTEIVEAFPAVSFVWMEGGIPLFPPGSNYKGNEVGEPIEDPSVYIRQVILPRFRPGLTGAKVVATEEMAPFADIIADVSQETGLQKKFRAARVRLEYTENSWNVQEDIYCVLASVYVPAARTTFWGPERNFSFRAEKGKVDPNAKIFQTIVSSYRLNLQWFNRYLQLLQVISQVPFDPNRPIAELGRNALQASNDITEARRAVYEKQQTTQDRVNSQLCQYLGGFEAFRSPFDQRPLHVPSGYAQVWTNPLGDFLLAGDPSFNPNTGGTNLWRKIDRIAR